MKRLDELVPDVDTFLALEASEVAGVVLEQLCTKSLRREMLNIGQYLYASPHGHFSRHPSNTWPRVVEHLMEGWAWLVSNSLIAPDDRQPGGGWVFVTRLGHRVASATGLRDYRKAFNSPKSASTQRSLNAAILNTSAESSTLP